jgi:hypothetical protein
MGAVKDHAAVSRMVTRALPIGMTRVSQSRFEWDVSGRCEAPVSVEMEGRPASDWIRRLKFVVVAKRQKHPLIVVLKTPCRKCRKCLKRRMTMWAARAMHEVREAERTWFATFTLSPQWHYVMQCRAVAIADARSIPTNELTSEEMSRRQSNEVEKELTLYIKRLRKKLPQTQIRYLLVREKHKSGLPHWHALIHEVTGKLSYRDLDEWEFGHAKFKLLVDERAAFYVAKYLGKSNEGRVRASIRYGRYREPKDDLGHSEDEGRSVISEYRAECEARLGTQKTSQQKVS